MTSLQNFLSKDKKITVWPKEQTFKREIIAYLSTKFELGQHYTKKEVDQVIAKWHTFNDVSMLRHEMLNTDIMCKTSSDNTYWISRNNLITPPQLKQGDRIAIVSLSSGMLGESYCQHYIALGQTRLKAFGLEPVFMKNSLKGVQYLKDHPEARAQDLKEAFADDSIAGIFCAIGGEDTFKLAPFLLDDQEFAQNVKNHPKIFTGFSDTTVNHLMLYKLGLSTFYGPNYINDFCEMDSDMLAYTKREIQKYYFDNSKLPITSSELWYEERTDFSASQMGISRTAHAETKGYELLKGNTQFSGELLGGCLESLYYLLTDNRYKGQAEINKTYEIFPNISQWHHKILFLETSQNQPTPMMFKRMLNALKEQGIFNMISGIIVGKPQNEVYYDDYKQVLIDAVDTADLPILYNVNFGHAYPRTVLKYGQNVLVDATRGEIRYL